MSSKALTLTAAIASACTVALGQTQSQNVVGYINVDLKAGTFGLIANQLDNLKGNKVSDLITGVQNNSIIYKFDNTTGKFQPGNEFVDGWDNPDQTLAPGEAAFVKSKTDVKVTFVGEVKQGASSIALRSGFNLISSVVPQALELDKVDTYGMKPANNDVITGFANGKYLPGNTYVDGFDAQTVPVGAGFWYFNSKAASKWDRTFTVQ